MATTEAMIKALESWRSNPAGFDPDQFWKLAERFRADLVNQAFALLGSQPDAEDVAQETLVAAFTNLSKLRDPKMLGNWMRKINHNNALAHRSRNKKAKQAAQARGGEEAAQSHTQALTHQEMIARAIDGLPDDLRSILALRYWEHLDYAAVGQRLGIPVGTVKSRLARADRMLEAKLRPVLGLEPVK